MKIDTCDMDAASLMVLLSPYLNTGPSHWCVAINGMDYEVRWVYRTGITVRTWDEQAISGVGEVGLIEWNDIETLKIY